MTVKTVLLRALEDLNEAEVKNFKWHLCNSEDLGIESIPRGKLENANRHDVVDIVVEWCGASEAGSVAVRVLRLINQNQVADQLEEKLRKVCSSHSEAGAGARAKVSSGSGGRGAQTSGVSVNIQSSSGGSVKAPVVQGGVFNGPVTFN